MKFVTTLRTRLITVFQGAVLASLLLLAAASASARDGTSGASVTGVPGLSIDDVTKAEGNVGTTAFTFTVTLSQTSSNPVTVQYQTVAGTANAVPNNDYVATSGTLVIPANTLSATLTIDVIGDFTLESDETFTVILSNPSGAVITDGLGTGTIQNDDVLPTMSISDVSLTEGNVGFKDFNFIVRLSNPSDQPITVDYQSANNTAIAPLDYLATGPLTLTFAPKTVSGTITVRVRGDVTFEPDETFFVNLSNAIGATLTDAQGVGTIINDDPEPPTAVLLSMFEAATVDEGIELRWQFSDATNVTATWIDRATAVTGPWTRIAAEVSEENGVMVAVDRSVEAGKTYVYRLVAELTGGQQVAFTPAEGTAGGLPTEFALARVSPNPTTDVARIEYTVAHEAQVRVSILDVQGRTVAQVVDAVQRPGRYQAVWNGAGAGGRMPAGVYFVRFDAGGKTGVKRVMLTR